MLSQRLTNDAAQSGWSTCTHCIAFQSGQPARQRLSGPTPLPPGRLSLARKWGLQKPRFLKKF